MKISPAIKGLITAVVMIIASLAIDLAKDSINPNIQYFVYVLYATGIIWTVIAFAKTSSSYTGRFAELFSQGFRCFIITTLLMVAFTAVFIKMHPEFAEQESIATREYYLKQGDKKPSEIEEMSAKAKKQYPVTVVSIAIFRYLIIGAGLTAAASALITRRK
jgi:hypothetical protein